MVYKKVQVDVAKRGVTPAQVRILPIILKSVHTLIKFVSMYSSTLSL